MPSCGAKCPKLKGILPSSVRGTLRCGAVYCQRRFPWPCRGTSTLPGPRHTFQGRSGHERWRALTTCWSRYGRPSGRSSPLPGRSGPSRSSFRRAQTNPAGPSRPRPCCGCRRCPIAASPWPRPRDRDEQKDRDREVEQGCACHRFVGELGAGSLEQAAVAPARSSSLRDPRSKLPAQHAGFPFQSNRL